MESFDTATDYLYRLSGLEGAPVVVYIPGIHGDWTPMWRAREVFNKHCRLLELAYPHAAADWTLEDYADRLAALLERLGLERVHLLAESFGSLVGWTFTCRHRERVKTLMLAGGFCRSPGRVRTAVADAVLRIMPAALLDRCVDLYLVYLVNRGFPKDAFLREEEFFPATRTRQGWRATYNRLRIIRQTDLRGRLCELKVPILYFGGALDIVVPVRREIKFLKQTLHAECCFQSVLFPRMPHPIIPACYPQVDALMREWIGKHGG